MKILDRLLQSLGRGPLQTEAASIIVPAIIHRLNPKSVLDVGCGDGAFLREFGRHGITAVGFDKSPGKPGVKGLTVSCDLTTIKSLPPHNDIVMCLEVAEHLPESAALRLIDLLCEASDIVLFGAGVPGIGGWGHISERWPSFWARQFLLNGRVPHGELRSDLWDAKLPGWYAQDLLIYTTPENGKRLGLTAAGLIDIVHPKVWQRIGLMGIRQRLTDKISNKR